MLKTISIILFSAVIAFAAPISHIHKNKKGQQENQKSYKEYTVQKGDTIYSIAKKFKVNMKDITQLNKMTTNLIRPNQIIKIPTKSYKEKAKEAVSKNRKTVYTVKRGDTLKSIARKFNMSVSELRKLNKFKRGKLLSVGSEINVYAPKKTLQKRKRVTKVIIHRGDTLWSLAKKYGLTMQEIRILNPKVRRQGLRKGMIIDVSKERAEKLLELKRLAKKQRKKKSLKGRLSRYTRHYAMTGSSSSKSSVGSNNKVVRYAKRFLGTPYVWGANSGRAFDCSGFTQYVMKHAKGRNIPRVSRRQAYYGIYVPRSRLRPADLVFFDTSKHRRGYVNHVGMYIGNHYFIHASSAKHRVVITSLNRPFYKSRFMWGRRIN